MSKSARAWESEIRDALRALPKLKDEDRPAMVAGLYQLMRIEFEDNLLTAKSPEYAAEPLPRSRPAKLAGRDASTAPACIARLLDVGLIRETAGGYDLPHVRRIFEIRSRDRGYKADDSPGVGNGVGIPTGGGSEMGSEMGSESPPQVPLPPTTPISSSPSPIIHSAGEDRENGDDLDRKLRAFIGGHRMLEWSLKKHAIARQMAESGGWSGMVQALDVAIAEGAAEPFAYARTVMASEQAKSRLKINKLAEKPAPQRLTKARIFDS